jgi:NTE family protein
MNGETETSSCRIGLALSGGGSRAIAFHLGCLRALNELGILEHVQVLSTVSGGSVIGALYASTDESFSLFESRVRELLAQGLVRPWLRKAFFTNEGLKALVCFVAVAVINLFVPFLRRISIGPDWTGWQE